MRLVAPITAGLVLASVFAAAMSTLSSSLNSSATALVNDLYLPLRRTPLSPRGQLRAGRWATAGFGLVQTGIEADCLLDRGLDHGAWVPLALMFPEADIPVIQLSVQTGKSPEYHLDLGRRLTFLREQGVLILGSGGATHDLPAMADHRRDDPPEPYAEAFDRWLEAVLTAGDAAALLDYRAERDAWDSLF